MTAQDVKPRLTGSFIQRVFGIGYNAAASLVERMESDGILAKPNHVGKREVLIKIAGAL